MRTKFNQDNIILTQIKISIFKKYKLVHNKLLPDIETQTS